MREITSDLKTHLSEEVTTLATCWKITRSDGLVMGFTDCYIELDVGGIIYDSIAGFTPTNVESTSDASVDNMDVSGQLYKTKITHDDLLAGLYDFANVEIFTVDYTKPNSGKLILKSGVIGEVTLKKNMFYAEIRGLSQFISQNLCETYSPHCRAQLGDHRCKFDLSKDRFTAKAVIDKIIDSQNFISNELNNSDYPDRWFKYGYLIWNSGKNSGTKMEIKEFTTGGRVTLCMKMAFSFCEGDSFTIVAGCDKSYKSCDSKFDNIVNFRGEPDVPTSDILTDNSRWDHKKHRQRWKNLREKMAEIHNQMETSECARKK